MGVQHSKTRTDGIVVPPRSNASISSLAGNLRSFLGLKDVPYMPIVQVYELLDFIVEGARFEVWSVDDMGEDHGRTYPEKKVIRIREDVYENAYNDKPRDRFTMTHELGHLLMHRGVALSRIDPSKPPKIYMNSEWQADKFASYLMMPSGLLAEYSSVEQVVEAFGVSYEAALARSSEIGKATSWRS